MNVTDYNCYVSVMHRVKCAMQNSLSVPGMRH